MPRYRLTVEYDGTGLAGWQRQANGPSVQAALEAAVQGFCGEAATLHAAGRTDAGVHALGQVAHVDLVRDAPADTVMQAVNAHLRLGAASGQVVVTAAARVGDAFHARFSAIARHYRYRILQRRSPPALDRGRVWWVPQALDRAAMDAAARRLIGRHDFTTFRARHCQARSPVKTLDRLEIRADDGEISVEASARSFLHHQVRNLVGTLVEVGRGRWTPDDVAAALAARDRAAGGPTAPPDGLYLVAVDYPPEAEDAGGPPAGA